MSSLLETQIAIPSSSGTTISGPKSSCVYNEAMRTTKSTGMNPSLKKIVLVVLAVLVVAGLTGCGGPNNVAHLHATHIAGFWKGLWDGMTSIIAFIISLFGGHTNIYEVHNNGGWYNFGFLLGIGAFSSGVVSSSHHSR